MSMGTCYDGTPDLMADYAVMARDSGAKIIGGCCGTRPTHLTKMREALETRAAGPAPSLEDIVEKIGPFTSENDGTGPGGTARTRTPRTAPQLNRGRANPQICNVNLIKYR
jgi:5-methyltetrahydrofolate--homocysteine methyltransferase